MSGTLELAPPLHSQVWNPFYSTVNTYNKKKGIGHLQLYGQLDFTVEVNLHEVNPLLVPVYFNTCVCVDYCKLYAKATGASFSFAFHPVPNYHHVGSNLSDFQIWSLKNKVHAKL